MINFSHSVGTPQPIQTLFFDMDGTLLDLAFDNFIWLECVPKLWAQQQQCSIIKAKEILYQFYLKHQGQLNWYSSKFWQQQLGIDVLALQQNYRQRIQPRAECFELLSSLQEKGFDCWLVTNADEATLQLKLETITLRPYFSHIISSESLGFPKEQIQFWQQLQQMHLFEQQYVALIDDNYAVLESAQKFGIKHLWSISQPDSTTIRSQYHADFTHLQQLTDLLDQIIIHHEDYVH
ncbi:HAD hydrolase-like protein [Acinetobacter qingfengensis]|uniref:Uncharacterized protein n=1 Tax=Acinetobacter qingfengensis TaxID=1262585 RepID=A0A1E7RE23_9GAMM|nr:HAD hydrolase-like protein [Acinetobacter qingfengensis]KAA8734378.1 HAD hydrolase-like protein [Acinetobacter qingfengensis]OEY97614.1 hypothetical protein BJI46_09035 [Acinetobacter qingfengensis]